MRGLTKLAPGFGNVAIDALWEDKLGEGPIFQALDPQDRMNRIRIENVVAFIESIQSK